MPVSRMRGLALALTVAGLAAAGVVAAGWLGAAEPPGAGAKSSVPVQAPDQAKPVDKADKGDAKPGNKGDGSVRVEAPGTKVAVDRQSGKVGVTAPHAEVQVDPEKGRVRVRAPYVDLDIRW